MVRPVRCSETFSGRVHPTTALNEREKILVVEGDEASRQILAEQLRAAGYDVQAEAPGAAAIDEALTGGVDLLLLDANLSEVDCCDILTRLKGSAATQDVRVILLAAGDAAERARGFDLGADDVFPRTGEPVELLARVRAQLRVRREHLELRHQMQVAEQGQQMAQTAFRALAVTEKMTRDAFSLDRALKIGAGTIFVVALLMAATYFLFFRRASQESASAYAAIAQLQRGISKQEDLLERSSKAREQFERSAAASIEEQRRQLEQQSADLQAQMATASKGELGTLRSQLDDTSTRLRRLETQGKVAQGIIRTYAPSVCLIHVVVAFRERASGRRLRYVGLNPQGEPIQDSAGNPLFDLEGRGPEVRANFFGTGFLVTADGRILTNRHVVEPWWKDDELNAITQMGLEAVIAEISAYFPGSARAHRVEIQKISPEVDLAVVQGSLDGLKRPALPIDPRNEAAVTGQPVVLLGYPTGLDAILARAGEDTVRSIVTAAGGNPRQIMTELAQRSLIRPLSTQGHIGDVLLDKIVYDAQTTSGGSGGPLFNAQGKVIGVNYAVVRGFGGSNFGIPIRYAQSLLR
jgi:DNA-binding response OmpR family regulator